LHDGQIESMRAEAVEALRRFRPATMGQASRIAGITPADLTLLSVLMKRHRDQAGNVASASSS
jgi:tRNA uridine 5-carboxymethylaminomethyl modification enzyme